MLISSITEAVGNTPLLKTERLCVAAELDGEIFAKLEMFNPYSVKDRAALSMLEGMKARGELSSVVEATSGNTGIGLCMACAAAGIPITIVMPENASDERKKIMRLLGAALILTPAADGMAGANERARMITEAVPGAVSSSQFDNPDNPRAHIRTAHEIICDLPSPPDIFVAAVGTGGTFTGIARELKAKYPGIKAFAVEPDGSPVLSGGKPGPHAIPGIGAGFVPANFDAGLCDGVLRVTDTDALDMSKLLAKTEGVLAGISSGAALSACAALLRQYRGAKVVTVLADSFERYLSIS